MLILRKSRERGHANHGWLDSYHSFSFADYHDPRFMGFRDLRVINEDRVAPGGGFPTHPHRDMEIVTYIIEGALEHKDSTGGGSVLHPGEIQRMSAGTGIAHSEFNPSKTEPVHLLQIWLLPARRGLAPGYEQRRIHGKGALTLLASPVAGEGAVAIHQDARIWRAMPGAGESIALQLAAGRAGWAQVAKGALEVNGVQLEAGDGAAITDETELRLTGRTAGTEALLFDLR